MNTIFTLKPFSSTRVIARLFCGFAFITLFFGQLSISAQTIRTVGTSGADYATLKAAFDDINDGDLTGDTELQITSSITDNTTAVLNASAFTVVNDTEITATAPTGDFEGKISLTNVLGTISSIQDFTLPVLFVGGTGTYTDPLLFAGGTGSDTDPYQIGNWTHLQNINLVSDEGHYFILLNNLNASSTDYDTQVRDGLTLANSGTGWNPIGNLLKAFNGHFDGANFAISNLNIDGSNDYQGLFGYMSDGSIKNLKLIDADIKASGRFVGGLVGRVAPGSTGDLLIQNIEIIDLVLESTGTTSSVNVGGVTGRIDAGSSSSATIAFESILVKGLQLTHTGSGNYVGGIVGETQHSGSGQITLRKLAVRDAVIDARLSQYVGGLVGRLRANSLLDDRNLFIGTLHGGYQIGGLVGRLSSNSVLNFGYVQADVTGYTTSQRGEIGLITGYTSTNDQTVTEIYAVGTAQHATESDAVADRVGIIGASDSDGDVFEDIYYHVTSGTLPFLGDVATPSSPPTVTNAVELTQAQMQGNQARINMVGVANTARWDFDVNWLATSGNYPIFRWEDEEFNVLERTIWYVKNDATAGADNGTSWDDAFLTIQQGIDAASAGDVVVVAKGTGAYTGSTTAPIALINENFNGAKLYGGYAGNESLTVADLQLGSRNLTTNATVIDGETDRAGFVIFIATSSFGGTNTDANLEFETEIDGFEFENTSWVDEGGGSGIVKYGSEFKSFDISLRNIKVDNGFNWLSGGGIGLFADDLEQVTLQYENITVTNSFGDFEGGGIGVFIRNDDLNPATVLTANFDKLILEGNQSDFLGGGGLSFEVWNTDGSLTISNSSFIENEANIFGRGGALAIIDDVDSDFSYTIINSIFAENSGLGAGAIYHNLVGGGEGDIINSTFYKNTAGSGTEIISASVSSIVRIANSIFVENLFFNDPDPLRLDFETPAIPERFKERYNRSNRTGSNLRTEATGPIRLRHVLVSEAAAGEFPVSVFIDPADAATIIYGATAAATFTNAAGGDFTLFSSSSAIDAGDNAAIPAGFTTDFAGNDRIQGLRVDMGAFEFASSVSEFIWTAASSTEDGGESGNWNSGVPPAGADIRIPNGATPYPVFDFNFQAGDIVLEGDATLTIAPGRVLTFGAGKGASRPMGDTGKIILKSNEDGDASIGNLTGAGSADGANTISVPVVQERFVLGGNRAFRFFSHPYTTAVPLSVIATKIDITGVGGSANGFTATSTNAPSAFRFNPLVGTGEANDGGWSAFTNTSQTIGQYEAIRILFRGSKGQANSLLDDGSYTPDHVTIEWEGSINQGTQTINLVGADQGGGVFSDWNLVGNPFPSGIDLSLTAGVTHTAGVLDYAIWQPRQAYTGSFSLIAGSGRGGAYLQVPTDVASIKIPSGGGFFIRAGGTSATLTIPEPAKTSVTPADISNVLRTEDVPSRYGANTLQIALAAENDFVDRVLVFLDNSYSAARELQDAPKMANPLANFFTVSEDDWALAIDRRSYSEEEGENRIPLHILAPNFTFTLSLPDFDLEEGRTIQLYDRLTEEFISLEKGTSYDFEVTDDPNSKGHRFDIVMGVDVVTSINPKSSRFQAFLLPNPAQEQVRISIQKPDNTAGTQVRIVSMTGVEVRNETLTTETTDLDINLNQLSKGVYLVEITHGTERIVKRLIIN